MSLNTTLVDPAALPVQAARPHCPAWPATVLVARVAAQTFAIDIDAVRELRAFSPLRSVPGRRGALLGLLELRGQVLPVFSLASLLGLNAEPPVAGDAIVMLSIDARVFGLQINGLQDVVDVDPSAWRAMPLREANPALRALIRFEDGLLPLLDPTHLMRLFGGVAVH